MSDPGEDQERPTDVEASGAEADGPWRNVPRPTTEELVSPSTQTVDTPSIPRGVKIVGLLIVIVLLLLSVWLGLSLGRSGAEAPTPTPSVDKALWDLEAPTQVGSLVRGDVNTTPGTTTGDRDILTATYTDGTDTVVLLLSRPENDLNTYLEDVNVTDPEPVQGADDISCGNSADNAVPFCARIVDDTAIAVAGLSEQDYAALTSLVDSFYEELR